MENFQKRAAKLGLQVYQSNESTDLIFTNWWHYLTQNDEFETVFSNKSRPLSSFLATFQPPTFTVFSVDDDFKLWFVTWFTLFSDPDSGIFMHYWCREDRRSTREHLSASFLTYDFATTVWPVVVGVTKHEHLLRVHRKAGYNIVGTIPNMLDGQDVWILYLTRELFEASKLYQTGIKNNGKR